MHKKGGIELYNMTDTAERIRERARIRGITVKEVLTIAGAGKNSLAHLHDGHAIACDTLARIADVLGVSIDYLMMRTDVPEVNKTKVE